MNKTIVDETQESFLQMQAAEKADAINWKTIPAFEHYEIRADGTVRRKGRKIVLTASAGGPRTRHLGVRELAIHMVNGYRAVSIKANGRVHKVYVDSLVRRLFS